MPLDIKQYLLSLKELNEIDNRLQQVLRELEAIPNLLEASGGGYLTLSRQLKEKEARLEAITRERLALEEEIKGLTQEVLEKEKRLYAIKTQKEYQATLKEIAKIKQENKQREERVLAILEETEKIQAEGTQLKSELADKEEDFKKVEGELNLRRETLAKEEEELKGKRPKILEGFPLEIMKKYERIKKRFSNPVAVVKKGVCQGCHMNLPPQLFNEMMKINDLRHCPNCHRLIYVEV